MAFDVEQLFGAVDILIERKLENVNFDKTIICTIVDDSDKKNGCYIVSDGTIKFKAYVSDATYNKDDQVRVSVLNGDFTEKKFIVGRYTKDEDTKPITYKYPLDTIIPITGNLIDPSLKNNVYSLRANSDIITKNIWQIDLSENQSFKDLQSNGIYNTITLKADFKTLLSNYDLIAGNYGLRLDLFIQPSADNPTQRIRKYITLDSSEMMGNPYSFFLYSTQAKKVDIMSTGVITEMVLWMYQSVDGDGKSSRFIDRNKHELSPNIYNDDIFVKNIEIGFGSDVTKVSDNTLELFTSSSQQYKYSDDDDANNLKEMEILWYNKTDENKYIGFSDGLFDLAYDEIQYLSQSNQDSRLIAQMGRTDIPNDESGLELAADHKDMKPIMIKAKDALTREVADVLYGLQRQIKGINSINTRLDGLLNTVDGSLVKQWNLADEAFKAWDISYTGVLQYAYDKQNGVENPSSWDSKWDVDYYTQFITAITTGISSVRDFFAWMEKATALPPPITQEDKDNPDFATQMGYRGDYDLYLYRIEKELVMIENWLDQLNSYLVDNYNKLIAYHNENYIFNTYIQKDFSSYDNKYCIYWYRYERGYKLEYQKDGNNDDYNYGNFMGDGWKRIEITDSENNVLLNFGVPREGVANSEDGKIYYPAKPLGQVYRRKMDKNLVDEKYVVVLFYNHEMYKSNIITFTNSEPDLIPNDMMIDQRDALKIEHDVYSQEHYQSYNEFNLLKSLEDGGKIRQLKCFYDGLYKKDEALIEAGLYWYVPNHSTMLTFDKDDLIKKGFATDADGVTEKTIPGYTYFYKKINQCDEEDKIPNELGELEYTCKDEDRYFFYKIKPSLEKDATNNTIKVKAYLKDVEYPIEGDITMTFSTFGTNGTKYTLSIVPAGSQNSVIGKDYPLQLSVIFKDSKNNPINIVDAENVNDTNAYGFSVESWNNLPNAFNITKIYDDTKTYIKGLTINLKSEQELSKIWDAKTPYFGIINAKISFKMNKDEFNKDQPPEEKVSEYQKYKVVDLNTLYAITYASSGMYYMSGATNIVYNNQGTISFVSEDEYVLYTVNDKGNIPVENQVWRMEYYDKDGNWIDETYENETTGEKPWDMLVNYMPVLNSENRLTPAPLCIEGLDYVPVVVCSVNGDIAWVQPIIITQNRYASSTLNDWNGSLTIDEKNGTILSTAVGAGKKDEQNRFWGVLMGDIGKGMSFDSDNMSGIGLYGFHEGAQSFCLSAEGTAFFGKAGRGRIYFDGNKGTISSASYEMVKRDGNELTAAGMIIDLDDGFIHMLGAKRTDHTYSPDYPDGKTSQAEVLISTGLMDGEKSAYFKIRSREQANPEHYLIYVDTDTYYLQTDDYNEWDYQYSDGEQNLDFSGAGLRLDLKDGILDAYNFQLSSKNVFINSTDETTAYFVIKDNTGVNLFYAAPNEYYLKSDDFVSMNDTTLGSGIKITLKDLAGIPRGIEAYNFDLRAGKTAGGDHEIIVSDKGDTEGNAYFQINTSVGKVTKTLVHISKSAQYFQSSDYDGSTTGIALSLSGKELKAFSGFHLKAYSSNSTEESPKYVEINADATTNGYPLRVANNFKVSWDGTISATGGTFTNINATGGNFTNIKVTGEFTSGTISGATIYAANLYAGGTNAGMLNTNAELVATSSGVTIKNATIENCTIKNNYGGNGSTVYINGAEGLLTARSAELETLIVTTSLTVKSAATSGKEVFHVDSSGNLVVHGKIYSQKLNSSDYIYFGSTTHNSTGILIYGNDIGLYSDQIWIGNVNKHTYINGYIKINAAMGIGVNPDETGTYNLQVDGNSKIDGDVLYTGEIYCTQKDESHKGVSGTYKVETGWWTSKQLTFDKGILVKIGSGGDTTQEEAISTAAPPIAGNANKFLQVDKTATTMHWTELGDLAFKDSIDATVVNFTDATIVEGPFTSGSDTYYTVKVNYSQNYSKDVEVDYSKEVEVSTTQWCGWNDSDINTTTGRVTSHECSEAYAIKNYKYRTKVNSSGTTTVTGTTKGTASGTVSGTTTGSVKINISAT